MSNNSIYFQLVSLINLTTEIKMLKMEAGERVEVTEYNEDHICFEVEAKSCAQGQLVKIEGLLNFSNEQIPFSGLGKVLKAQPLQKTKLKIMIELRSHNQELWGRFTSALKDRQDSLDKMFKSMRDEE